MAAVEGLFKKLIWVPINVKNQSLYCIGNNITCVLFLYDFSNCYTVLVSQLSVCRGLLHT